jgi:transcriptional regulator with XRE-family HTH domain
MSIPEASNDDKSIELADLTSELVRAARALLRWEQRHLAKASGVSLPTIKRLESQRGTLRSHGVTATAIRRALEAAGIEFINGGQPGVRLTLTAAKKIDRSD